MSARFRKPWQNTIIHFTEAFFVYLLYGIFRALPIDIASNFGGWMGRNLAYHMGATKKALKNLRLAFPHKPDSEINEIARGMWDNLGRNAGEAARLGKLYTSDDTSRIEVVGAQHLIDAYAEKKGVLIVGGHLANWEIGGLVCKALGINASAIYRPPNNPHVDKLIKYIRANTTFTLLPKGPEGARGILRELRAKNCVGLLVDQKLNEGINVPFFGLPAMTAPAVASMALRTGCILIPCQTVRTHGAHFKVIFYPPVAVNADAPDKDAETLRIMTEINNMIESWVRAYPEQWLWLHHRFTKEVYAGFNKDRPKK